MSKRKVCTLFDDFIEKTMDNTVKIHGVNAIHRDDKFISKTIQFFTKIINMYVQSPDQEYLDLIISEFQTKLSDSNMKLVSTYSDPIEFRDIVGMRPFSTKARYFEMNASGDSELVYANYRVCIGGKYVLCMDMGNVKDETLVTLFDGDKKRMKLFKMFYKGMGNDGGFLVARFSVVEKDEIEDRLDGDESDAMEGSSNEDSD